MLIGLLLLMGCDAVVDRNGLGIISGEVLQLNEEGDLWEDSQGNPYSHHLITVHIRGTTLSGATNREGKFRITGVPPGDYSLDLIVHGHGTWTEEFSLKAGEKKEITDLAFFLDAPKDGDLTANPFFLYINNNTFPRELRRAVSLYIDKEEIVALGNNTYDNYLDEGSWIEANSFFFSHHLAFEENEHEYDLEKAKQIIKDNNWEDWEIEILTLLGAQEREEMGQIMANNLEALGLEPLLLKKDWGDYLEKILEGDYDMVIVSWGTSFRKTTMTPLFNLFHSESPLRISGVSNSELDQMIEEGLSQYNEEKYIDSAKEINQLALEEYFSIPLFFLERVYPLD